MESENVELRGDFCKDWVPYVIMTGYHTSSCKTSPKGTPYIFNLSGNVMSGGLSLSLLHFPTSMPLVFVRS